MHNNASNTTIKVELKRMHLTCRGCGFRCQEFPETNSVGDMAKSSDFTPLFTHDGEMLWLCSICFNKASGLALQILDIVKNEHFYFPNLIHKRQ